ncbi:FxsB family radical SAM/SPASM domain protein [Herbidospora galbida]|uniref:FxsB family radical SAM/SPASM domain protein n=1 Tax=Herbidospora galbida TaxID=2575442 RepID=A0A4U3MIW4_9ACTN|nr:FxsB family cyclophane-forming radical SAM/SPASM peptide maturase [Herbidospora galbida]TKK89315.1 FxsB family radical SAM/SPASM domain protein [Herbidospora galbida]
MSQSVLPLSQYVLKVHSRCDLACDHCYVYENADTSWRGKPAVLALDTSAHIADRIAEHAAEHALSRVNVVLHGGEPLLAGPARLNDIATTLRDRLPEGCVLDLRIHTNGVLLNRRFLDVFEKHEIMVGVSLDGDREANDRHRRYRDGRSSYDQVVRAINLLHERPHLFAGLLCTIDVENDPIAVYEALRALDPPRIDFLLPHATWDEPPHWPAPTAYADWLIAIYERWESQGRPVEVRIFDSVIRTLHGEPSLTEAIGLEPSALLVVETDGSYEQVDSLKVTFDGAPATGQDVFRNSVSEAATHPGIVARRGGVAALSAECRRCPLVTACGGGLYPHRFRAGSFDNPSVYCQDLFKLISHIRDAGSMENHKLELSQFATGFGGWREMRALTATQSSIRRGAMRTVGPQEEAAWAALRAYDKTHRHAVDRVLAHPFVREWAVQAAQKKTSTAYLGNIVAAVALAAAAEGTFTVEVEQGAAHFPSIGTLTGLTGSSATVSVAEGEIRHHAPARWLPARRLTCGDFSVLIEDSDPFRDCYQLPLTGRLTAAELTAWQTAFDAAWHIVETEFPEYAPGLRAGLTTIVPLTASAGDDDVSSTARTAFGAVAAALPRDPATLALLIIHEFQHVKLGAVFEAVRLFDPKDTRLHYAPWRPDPRPLEGLFQGTYAHIAVADFWRRRRITTGAFGAHVQFARWREQTAEAAETLLASGVLTETGVWFVERMRETLTPWLTEEIPAEAVSAAKVSARAHHEAFETQNQ